MVGDKPFSKASHQTTRLGPGRHRKRLEEPGVSSGPETIAEYVVELLARRARSPFRNCRWDEAGHERMIALLERLIATGRWRVEALLGEFVEHPGDAVEDGGGDQELIFAELGEGSAPALLEPGASLFHGGPS